MLTYPTLDRPSRRTLSLALPLVLIIAACGSAAAPSSSPPGESPRATPTAVPGAGGGTGAGGGAGSGGNTGVGTAPGNPGGGGIGIDLPFPVVPGPDDALLGDATNVVPVPGRLNPHPVNVQLVRAASRDGNVWAELRWYSGVEECYATDSVRLERDDVAKTIRLTVMEGSNEGELACIDIALLKATVIDLGSLASGTWAISAAGDAPAIELEVP